MSVNADLVEHLANQFAVELLLNDAYLAEHEGCSLYDFGKMPLRTKSIYSTEEKK